MGFLCPPLEEKEGTFYSRRRRRRHSQSDSRQETRARSVAAAARHLNDLAAVDGAFQLWLGWERKDTELRD